MQCRVQTLAYKQYCQFAFIHCGLWSDSTIHINLAAPYTLTGRLGEKLSVGLMYTALGADIWRLLYEGFCDTGGPFRDKSERLRE